MTAELETPALVDAWWPVPLDSLLMLAPRVGIPVGGHRVQLPLVRWHRGLNKQWVWAVSCAALEVAAGRRSERVLRGGTFRWVAAGDPAAILAVLSTLGGIGTEWRSGRGRVARWSVRDLGPFAPADLPAVVWRADGYVSRPLPVRAAPLLGLDAARVRTVPGAVRPPYELPPPTSAGTREWRTVLAPWTRRVDPQVS